MSQSPPSQNSETTPCPTCGEPVGPRDKFCSICGANLAGAAQWVAPVSASASGGINEEITPLSGTAGSPEVLTRRRKKQKARWFKRPLFVIPLVLLLILGSIGGVIAWQTRSALKEVHSISTPPPEISAANLGGNEDAQIDTGPAQQALNDRATRDAQGELPATRAPETAEPTTATSGGGDATTQPTETAGAKATETAGARATETTGNGQQPTQSATTTSGNLVPAGSTVAPGETAVATISATEDSTDISATENGTEVAAETAETAVTEEAAQSAVVAAPVESGGLTVLLMGVDSRDGEAIDIGVRPDSLAVLHLDEQTGSCRMLAVPRDSRAELPGYGSSKINHALAVAGIPYEMLVIEEYLGLTLDHYALIDFAGLETVVDNLGGITVENPEEFVMGDQTFAAGTLDLNGEQALLYSRFRGDNQGDFGRISRQQQVLRALLDKASGVNVVSTLPNMFNLLSDHFRTDFGVTDLVGLADDYRTSCTSESIETRTIPGDVSMEYDELMEQDLSFVVSDPEQVRADVAWLLGVEPVDEATPTTRLIPFTIQQDQQVRRTVRGRTLQNLPI